MKCRMRVKNVHWDELISEVVFFLKIGKRLSPPTLESGIDIGQGKFGKKKNSKFNEHRAFNKAVGHGK